MAGSGRQSNSAKLVREVLSAPLCRSRTVEHQVVGVGGEAADVHAQLLDQLGSAALVGEAGAHERLLLGFGGREPSLGVLQAARFDGVAHLVVADALRVEGEPVDLVVTRQLSPRAVDLDGIGHHEAVVLHEP